MAMRRACESYSDLILGLIDQGAAQLRGY